MVAERMVYSKGRTTWQPPWPHQMRARKALESGREGEREGEEEEGHCLACSPARREEAEEVADGGSCDCDGERREDDDSSSAKGRTVGLDFVFLNVVGPIYGLRPGSIHCGEF